ncbi:hypothetical protein A3A64_04775 [Candidatus Gottesmanbacteria bacterium RIFCSPLOWO2_01_FULL_48_11]|nr:MAG: hypothetical protein A3A64_04775 [Candidatus Gottesmanbacteria bacterium RIFCSPLOWO2_01_FULL_48_11]
MNLLDLLFPKRCVGCGRLGNYFCKRCISSIKIIQANEAICPVCEKPAIDGATHPRCQTAYTIDGLTSFFRYDGVIRKAVKAVKYRYISDLAKEFVGLVPSLLFSNLYALSPKPCFFVPIPLHWMRLRDRGFNQAEVLARNIAGQLHVAVYPDILKRTKVREPQVHMKSRKDRLANMDGVFAVSNDTLTHRHIDAVILFDDVFTTGATMRAAANVLKRAGITRVWGVTMAR